ncbi:MAG: DUF2309 domain-containing protein [Cocleimonas sp.]|nr:DUF2309 domain-containing protein [Cocleimonas sp.]
MSTKDQKKADIRAELLHVLAHFEHTLPAQASIRDFVHHNTLHGYQHMKFEDALKASNDLTGAYSFWSQEKFRTAYLKGRLNDSNLDHVLLQDESLHADKVIFDTDSISIKRKDIYRTALIFPIKPLSSCQLKWQIDEAHALELFQKDCPTDSKKKLITSAKRNGLTDESEVINDLWDACVDALDLDPKMLHAEDLLNLSQEQANKMFGSILKEDEVDELQHQKEQAWLELDHTVHESKQEHDLEVLIKNLTGVEVHADELEHGQSKITTLVRDEAWQQLERLLNEVGTDISLRTLMQRLTGTDVQDDILQYLQRFMAAWLDEGLAAWNPDRSKGFYHGWKESALEDQYGALNNIPEWNEYIESLPDDSLETVIAELTRMDIPEEKWADYIERIALDLPGWSGMFFWRHQNPGYEGHTDVDVNMMDYLAVRLILEHMFVRRLCRELWLIEGSLTSIRGYFRVQNSEFLVRNMLYNQHLPEYLISLAQQLIERDSVEAHKDSEWLTMAHMIWTWQQSPVSDARTELHLHRDGWRLFRLAQHLGLSAMDVRQLNTDQTTELFDCVRAMQGEAAGFLLLKAYEVHYRNKIFSAVQQNQGRGTWATRNDRPQAQMFFCMDDREEGFRRHLEHFNPKIETFGAAAFFGVVMNWNGVENDKPVALCPVVVTPEHEITEIAKKGHEAALMHYKDRHRLRVQLQDTVLQETRRGLLSSTALMVANVPLAAATLVGKAFAPLGWNRTINKIIGKFDGNKTTRINYAIDNIKENRTTEDNQLGYTLEEQANIVEGFLQNNGLLSGFAPLVIMMGHYSRNQNNPHAAAYGCGACSGKFSGPNARAFAAMANTPAVRDELATRSIDIPIDTWFLCGEHDTCNERVVWDDTDLIPVDLRHDFEKLQAEVKQAGQHSAHERCRKLASAPRKPTLASAIKHIAGRGVDYSQARPELGHATIAVGFVGRRYLSQGLFMDRRCFLISYDANVDPEGSFLERLLLSAGPVGAGISLEYYFSAVNNEKYGCGSKIVHNLSGLFGVMEGANSDLRTGLPQQMIEIHEPMRLQLVVEATTETLTEIYMRQPSIQELVGNGWILLSAKDPDSEVISTFDPNRGWEVWQDSEKPLPTIDQSSDWYAGNYDHLTPALIKQQKKVTANV